MAGSDADGTERARLTRRRLLAASGIASSALAIGGLGGIIETERALAARPSGDLGAENPLGLSVQPGDEVIALPKKKGEPQCFGIVYSICTERRAPVLVPKDFNDFHLSWLDPETGSSFWNGRGAPEATVVVDDGWIPDVQGDERLGHLHWVYDPGEGNTQLSAAGGWCTAVAMVICCPRGRKKVEFKSGLFAVTKDGELLFRGETLLPVCR